MLDRQVKNSLRADIFRHLDGIVTAPTAYSLYSNSVLDYILEKGTVEIKSLAQDLKDNFNILLEDLLNVRTFLDHNRIWKDIPKAKRIKTITSQGAFAYKGMRINNNALEENLRQHLELWKPYINKFGLLAIELHTISPSLISENLGKTPATAYNATHGYSDQYILELKIFRTLAESVGLQLNQDASCRFPESDLATVSINYFEGKI